MMAHENVYKGRSQGATHTHALYLLVAAPVELYGEFKKLFEERSSEAATYYGLRIVK